MIKSSNEAMRSYDFKTDKLCVNAVIAEDKPSYETVLSEAESCQEKYDDDYLSDEDQIELLQQNEFINSLFCERNCFNGDMTVMSDDDKFYMFARITCEEKKTVDIVIKEENGTTGSYVNVHTQLGKGFTFQHI